MALTDGLILGEVIARALNHKLVKLAGCLLVMGGGFVSSSGET